MSRLFKYAEEQGRLKQLRKTIIKLLKKKFSEVPAEVEYIINQQKEAELEKIAEEIIVIDTIKNLKDFLGCNN